MNPALIVLLVILGLLLLAQLIYFFVSFYRKKKDNKCPKLASNEPVYQELLKIREANGGYLYRDVFVAGEYGKVMLIEFIYVCKYGIYVFQTDNEVGQIIGDDNDSDWTRHYEKPYRNVTLYSPVIQNETNLLVIDETVGFHDSLKNIVVFLKADISKVRSLHTCNVANIKDKIGPSASPMLSEEEIISVSNRIQQFVDHPVRTKEEHRVITLKEEEAVRSGVCPLCGGALLMRISTRTGRKFWGCTNYPNCLFRKDL